MSLPPNNTRLHSTPLTHNSKQPATDTSTSGSRANKPASPTTEEPRIGSPVIPTMVAIKPLPAPPARSPLSPAAHLRLPPGSARPRGWLRTELTKQLHGLNGNLEKLSKYIHEDTSGWLHPDAEGTRGWEEVPYWLRGYASMAIALRDADAVATVKRWVDGTIASQAEDGFFGPNRLRGGKHRDHDDEEELHGREESADVWSHLPMMQAIRTYGEFAGDERVVPFFVRFFGFLARAVEEDAGVLTRKWINFRWAEALDLLAWTHGHDPRPELVDLAHAIHAGSASWLDPEQIPTPHNVNIAQGFREPALYSVFSGDPAHLGATYAMYDSVMAKYGQFPGGGFAGDENVREGYSDPRQGFEVCGVVEMMSSHEALARLTGDALWADRVEDLAFNNLPAGLDPEGRAIHYVNCANGVALVDRPVRRDQFDNTWPMRAYASDANDRYRCCAHNYGVGWPYYVEEMWVRHAGDGGIVANLHGPSEVEFEVKGEGGDAGPARVTIVADGSYPFSENLIYTVTVSRPVAFPFYVRIPGWAATAEFGLPDGTTQTVTGGRGGSSSSSSSSSDDDSSRTPTYHLAVAGRTWKSGDQLTVRFPMSVRTKRWPANHGAVSVYFGPQAFSLRIEEEWMRVGGTEQWPAREVRPASPWNYALEKLAYVEVTRSHGNHLDPFTPDNTPLKMTAHARRVPRWKADEDDVVGVLGEVGESPLGGGAVATEETQVALVPMGAARLRITMFPVVEE